MLQTVTHLNGERASLFVEFYFEAFIERRSGSSELIALQMDKAARINIRNVFPEEFRAIVRVSLHCLRL